jgi:hypothetical protein
MDKSSIFALSNVDSRIAHVRIWTSSHPVLIIGAKDPISREISWLRFGTPMYFEGPSNWIGADFYLESEDLLRSYIEKKWSHKWNDIQISLAKLFVCKIKDTDAYIRIIASNARLVNEDEMQTHNLA